MDQSERADVFLVSHGFAASRAEAQAAIKAGRVTADGRTVGKAAQRLNGTMTIPVWKRRILMFRAAA